MEKLGQMVNFCITGIWYPIWLGISTWFEPTEICQHIIGYSNLDIPCIIFTPLVYKKGSSIL